MGAFGRVNKFWFEDGHSEEESFKLRPKENVGIN